jgi:GDP-L-fucose synthase
MQYGMNSFNFLIPNTFGPGDYADPNRTHALNGMIIRMIKAHRERKSEFEIWGTGKPIREWAYIEDVVKILKRALVLQKDLTYPVNIAQNKGYSIRGSAELIAKGIGYRGKLVYNTDYQDGAPKKVLDNRRFRGLFPDYKFINHEEAIRRTIRYYESVLR